MEKNKVPIKEQIVNVLSLPEDLVLGRALISCIGRNEIYIENYICILKYNCDEIVISTKAGSVCLKGRNIQIDYYTCDEMKIIGIIDEIKFIQEVAY